MAVALGGRIAEELIFGEDNVTTGASNDFMQVCSSYPHPHYPYCKSGRFPNLSSLETRSWGIHCIDSVEMAEQVARTAKMMVTQMGFSKKLGQVAWTSGGGPSFLGQSMGQPADCSGQTSDEIDQEVKALVDRAYR